jgi:hypothetical protein
MRARRSGKKPKVGFLEVELVSPVLQGQQGLVEVARALRALNTLPVEVNWRTGLHIHVRAYTFGLSGKAVDRGAVNAYTVAL